MTTIVRHKRTGNKYILLGINGEENKTNPSRFINELFSQRQEKTEISCSATVCDVQGNLFLAYIDDLIVVEIDGKRPADILPEPSFTEPVNDPYQSQSMEFEDEEFEDDNFDEEEFEDEESDRVIITPPESSAYSQDKPDNDDSEDNDDWI